MTRWAAIAALFVARYAVAQTKSSDPTFTFTPSHGNKITQGRFSPGGSISFIDQFDDTTSSIEISKIERIVMTPRKAPYDSKCGASPEVIVTFVDGSRQRGCFAPGAPLAFIGSAAITSVNSTNGKFLREKR
jgi:hypothetical protein